MFVWVGHPRVDEYVMEVAVMVTAGWLVVAS
jgi:hypothetical protein